MGRLTLMGIVPAVSVIVVLVAFNSYRRYMALLQSAEMKLTSDAGELAMRIDASSRVATEVARGLALAQSTGMFGERRETVELLRRTLDQHPDITAAYVCYEPNADGKDATEPIADATTPPGPRSDGFPETPGRFVPYVYREGEPGNEKIGLKPTTLMESGSYYLVPRDRFRAGEKPSPLVTEPYEYEGQFIVEQTWPIIRQGKFVGIAGADRSLDKLSVELRSQASEAGADIFVLSPGGKIVAATDASGMAYIEDDPDSLRAKPFEKTLYKELFKEFVETSAKGKSFTVEKINPGTGAKTFFTCAPVATGNWLVVVAVPSSAVVAPIYQELGMAWGIALAGLCAIVVILYIPARQLVNRVVWAADAARQVAAGDLTREAACVECPDETGDLLRSIDSMTNDLNTLVGQVRTASNQLTGTASELAATSRQQEEVAASFGASSSEIAAAVREITTTGQELAREMVHVSESAGATAQLAQEGRTQLEGMEGAMQSLDHATSGVADRLAAINEKAVNITGVVTTITKVAEQTNLLSVNAAIEAEKAGEYGRGFLVVAREIRRLADQTAQATLDIERMVKEMQTAVSSGVMEMDRFSDQVRRNVGDVRTIGRSMQEIIVRVDEGTRSFGTVREGMQSQAAGAGQISEAMTTLSANAKATSESVRAFGRATEELQKAIGLLKSAVAAFHLRT